MVAAHILLRCPVKIYVRTLTGTSMILRRSNMWPNINPVAIVRRESAKHVSRLPKPASMSVKQQENLEKMKRSHYRGRGRW